MVMTNRRRHKCRAGAIRPPYAGKGDDPCRDDVGELRLLCGDPTHRRVLEIGCGDGAGYQHLGFAACGRYVGVDSSAQMLAFSARLLDLWPVSVPGPELVHADGARYRSGERFDLILAGRLPQQWDHARLAAHVRDAVTMLAANGAIVIGGIPWSGRRSASARRVMAAARGRARPGARLGCAGGLAHQRHRYDLSDITELAAAHGLRVEFSRSVRHPSWFHAVLRR